MRLKDVIEPIRLAKLVRFDPISSGTGGLFICKMIKKVEK